MNKRNQAFNSETVSQTLANNATGLGADHAGLGFSTVRAFVFADQAGTLAVEQSYDGSTWRQTDSTTTLASTAKALDGKVIRSHVRVTFKNTSGSAACSVVELDAGLYT